MPRQILLTILMLMLGHVAFAQAAGTAYATYFQKETEGLPGKITALIDCSDLSKFPLPQGDDAESKIVDVQDQPFAQAIQVTVKRPVTPAWNVQLSLPPSLIAVKKGDVLLVGYNVRCTESKAESGGGHFAAYLQLNREPWTGTGSFTGAPGKKWFKGYYKTIAENDYAPGELQITAHLGQYAQTIEFGGMYVLDLGQGVDLSKLPVTKVTYAGREADAPWRKAAQERIEQYRKADLQVQVTDAAGKPVPNAQIHVQMKRHAYQFGTFLEDSTLKDTPDGQKYRDMVVKLFNRATVPTYWADWGWPGSKPQYLALAQWAKDHGMYTRGHNLIWPDWRWMPTSMRQYEKDPAKLKQMIDEHFVDVVGSFRKFEFDDYDVVNELRDNHAIPDILGYSEVAAWFKLAHKLDPKPRLGINEYSIIAGGGYTEGQQQTYEDHIRMLLGYGAPLGVIGMQCHFGEDMTPPDRIPVILDRFAKFGLPIHATEFDINTFDEEAQGDYMRDFVTVFFSHPATEAITQWGFWEGQHWIPKAALFRKDWSVKPNGKAFMDLVLKQWWTDTTVIGDASGKAETRGFLGDYEVTVTANGKTTTMPAKIARGGSILRVQMK